ncbi:hypothetical protein FD754_020457 [Muntiacus muntjak]|uniref:Uncharacterized protein n=1 Tax=Muntiacus muntjak TaxID=9888 RepID=A0A5N3V576_MUNMU|nr:hypothetical protein FD754_020457 [Muntiacus muntjak]
MAQSQGWLRRYFKAFCKGFFVAVPAAATFLDRPSLNPGGSQSSDVVLLNHWKLRNFEAQRADLVSLHKPESRLLGEISLTSDMQMTPPLWQKSKRKINRQINEINQKETSTI